MKKMLLVFSHPDDESFSVGGTISKYAKLGWTIDLLVATNGEKGSSGTFTWAQGDALGALRQEELKKAGKVLGLSNIEFLGLPDLGLSGLTAGTLEDPIYQKMIDILPDVVITFGPRGISNHPDHIKTSYAATYAFQKYATYLDHVKNVGVTKKGRGKEWKEEEYIRTFGETGENTKEPKLYYVCLSQSSVNFLIKAKQIPEESFGLPWQGIPDKDITTVIDIHDDKLAKGKALLAHETQTKEVDRFISFAKNPEVDEECFVLRMQGQFEVYMGKADRISDALE